MADKSNKKEPTDRAAAAEYLASLLEEMSPLAQRHGLDVAAYLLDMAHMEVSSVSRRHSSQLDRLG
jgi:hypothetical protein